jgi:hypothetical protein
MTPGFVFDWAYPSEEVEGAATQFIALAGQGVPPVSCGKITPKKKEKSSLDKDQFDKIAVLAASLSDGKGRVINMCLWLLIRKHYDIHTYLHLLNYFLKFIILNF